MIAELIQYEDGLSAAFMYLSLPKSKAELSLPATHFEPSKYTSKVNEIKTDSGEILHLFETCLLSRIAKEPLI